MGDFWRPPPRPDADLDMLSPAAKPKSIASVIEPKIGHHFTRPSLLWQALQLDGYPKPDLLTPEGNKRLAVVGNLAMKLAIADYYRGIGAVSQRIADMADSTGASEFLKRLGQKMGLEEVVDLSAGDATEQANLEMAVRAVFGALFVDGGLSCVSEALMQLQVID